jgi:uncharacterized protein (TIGR00288 family)
LRNFARNRGVRQSPTDAGRIFLRGCAGRGNGGVRLSTVIAGIGEAIRRGSGNAHGKGRSAAPVFSVPGGCYCDNIGVSRSPGARSDGPEIPARKGPMAQRQEVTNMALFCDFENIALGVRDAKYAQFDIKKVLERLLLKGSIVVKKAYCDWERYKEFKATMHEAAFELIEIPHVRQSGKNSADIRMVVDALDLCYTKAHVDTFVIISGDSDFSPLVSKLRENNKYVIGIGVKDSTSDLLSANCDEFIFYDDLVRAQEAKKKRAAKKAPTKPAAGTTKAGEAKSGEAKGEEDKRQEALDFIVETVEALIAERGSDEKIWGSMVKTTMQRRKPGFTESSYGYRSFKELVEDAQSRKLLKVVRDEKSGQYTIQLPATE